MDNQHKWHATYHHQISVWMNRTLPTITGRMIASANESNDKSNGNCTTPLSIDQVRTQMVSTLLQVRSEVSASMFQTLTHVKPSFKWLASLPMRFNIRMDSYIDYQTCLQNTNISGREEWKDQVQNVEMNIGGFNKSKDISITNDEIKETSAPSDMAQAKKEYEDSLFNLYDEMKDEDNVCQIDISPNCETTHTENDLSDMYESMKNDHMMGQKSNQINDGINSAHSAQNEMMQSNKGHLN